MSNKTVLETIEENCKKVENGTNETVGLSKIRQHHSGLSYAEIGNELDVLLTKGEIYEAEPAKFCVI